MVERVWFKMELIAGEHYNFEAHDAENCDCGAGNFDPCAQGVNEGCYDCFHACFECGILPEYQDQETELGCSECNPNFNQEKENLKMSIEDVKYKNIIALLNKNITTVTARFINKNSEGKGYMFKCNKMLAKNLVIDDLVVVEHGDKGNFQILQVIEIHKNCEIMPESEADYKWLLSKVDTDGYRANIEFENINVEALKAKRREEIRNKFIDDMQLSNVDLVQIEKD